MLDEVRETALLYREKVFNDLSSSDEDKKYAEDLVTFLKDGDNFNRVAPSICYCFLFHLGYSNYGEIYEAIMAEVNRKYILIDPDNIVF